MTHPFKNIREFISVSDKSDPLALVAEADGYYECPKDGEGKRLGPLVGYAGKSPRNGRQLVGDVYVNFAKAEEYPHLVEFFAIKLSVKIHHWLDQIDVVCGLPLGGLALAYQLALVMNRRYAFPEKEVTAIKTENSREESRLVFSRHEILFGQGVILVEDVLNNFSTTDKSIQLVEQAGGHVIAIAGFLNRSPDVENSYQRKDGRGRLPVAAVVRKAIPEYDDDDIAVADDIRIGNIIRKPKNDWEPLRKIMRGETH